MCVCAGCVIVEKPRKLIPLCVAKWRVFSMIFNVIRGRSNNLRKVIQFLGMFSTIYEWIA